MLGRQQHWKQQSTKLNEIYLDIAYKPVPSCRKDGVTLRKLRIGHTALTYKHLLVRQKIPTCEICDVRLSVQHILVECPKYVPEKKLCLGDNLNDSLEVNLSKIKKLMNFLNVTELYNLI